MKGEHTVQLSIICRDSAPSGQEELRTESFTVTVKDRAEEAVSTKPGVALLTAPAITGASPQTFITYCFWIAERSDRRPLMSNSPVTGEKLLTLRQRLQLAMAQRRQEERLRKAELTRLDNEDCEEEEEEEDMTDESEEEEVGAGSCLLLFVLIVVIINVAVLSLSPTSALD